jgi:multiple sugar transport system substrate-binding protein
MANFIEANAPDMKWAAVPFPHPADRPDLAGTSYIDMDILVIPRGAAHPDEAWEFINYVQSQEGMELLCMGQKKHSPLAEVSDEFWEKHENPFIRLFYDVSSSPNAIVPPKIAVWPEIAAEMNAAYDTIQNGGDVETALRKVDERMQPRLDKALKMRRLRNAAK